LLDFNNFKENLEVLGEDIFSKKFLLAVSGGADSMVLSHLFRFSDTAQNDKGLEFQVAHVNYHFRGENHEKQTCKNDGFTDSNNNGRCRCDGMWF
jgi:tRNA(Ile)-lysidine synthase